MPKNATPLLIASLTIKLKSVVSKIAKIMKAVIADENALATTFLTDGLKFLSCKKLLK